MAAKLKFLVVLAAFAVACSDSKKKDDGVLTARIVEPNGTSTILKSSALRLSAAFADGKAEVTPDSVSWTSSIVTDIIPQTNPAENVVLIEGQHIIKVKGVFGKKQGEATVTVNVGDLGVQIVRPTNDRQVAPGDTVNLQGAAVARVGTTDVNLSPTTATFAWDADGVAFGTNQATLPSPNTLAVGEHTITLTVSYNDVATSSVLTATASITLNVNTTPSVSITAPACPFDLEAGGTQVFAGVASDAEDGPLTGSWLDLLTNASAAGDTWTYSTNIVGKHELVYSATDSSDATGKATCAVRAYSAGGSPASLFPSTAPVQTAMPNDNVEVAFVEGGDLIVGTHGQLGVFDGAFTLVDDGVAPSDPYDGNELGVGGGTTVQGVVISGGKLLAATADGVASCAYAAGVVSACSALDGRSYNGIAAIGDLSGTGLVAVSSTEGLFLVAYSGGNPTSHFYARNVLSTHENLHDVVFVGSALYVATDAGVCVINDPAAAAMAVAATLCDSVIDVGAPAQTLAYAGNTLWVGTEQGLVRRPIAGTSSITYSRDDGLPAGNVNDIAIDGDGVVWVATDSGVGRLDPKTANIVTLRPPDWTGSAQVNSVSIAPDGSKWFGTVQGVVHYVGA